MSNVLIYVLLSTCKANVMMVGEMLCMLAYLVYIYCFSGVSDSDTSSEDKDTPKPNMFLFLPPALCDVVAARKIVVMIQFYNRKKLLFMSEYYYSYLYQIYIKS